MGRVGHNRGDEKGNGSDASSHFNKNYKGNISKPMPQEEPYLNATRDEKTVSFAETGAPGPSAGPSAGPRPRGSTRGGRRGSTRRSSGWNRYWSGGSPLNIGDRPELNRVMSGSPAVAHPSSKFPLSGEM